VSHAWREFAPAKINLFLHVGPVRGDGYHPIHSLMTFADVGDEVSAAPGESMDFAVDGPFSGGLGADKDNLVVRARDALLETALAPPAAFRLVLSKRLPIAAGLGGGSADAAAALRLMRRALGLDVSDEVVAGIARALGADVYACLLGQPTMATGRGDVLSPAPGLPALHAVLANPLVPSQTAEVYRAYDEMPAEANKPCSTESFANLKDTLAFLDACRNDLEAPAVRLRSEIGEVLAALVAQPETLLARMSGSGATCFAICECAGEARALATRLSRHRPGWWVRQTLLRGSPT
jgi:4-diphosphocytidyl-2-C-methyl-D-erythritol kinase